MSNCTRTHSEKGHIIISEKKTAKISLIIVPAWISGTLERKESQDGRSTPDSRCNRNAIRGVVNRDSGRSHPIINTIPLNRALNRVAN